MQGKFSLRIDKRGSGEYNNTVVNLLMLRKSKSQSVKCHGDGELPRGRKADLFGHCPAVSCGSMAASRFILQKDRTVYNRAPIYRMRPLFIPSYMQLRKGGFFYEKKQIGF